MILRGACYERVSSEEQAKFGFSIKAQVDALNEYCINNNIKIVDHYTDEGISAGKPFTKRPEMLRLLEDVKAGKIDIIMFTRLDRWYRSTKWYYKVQEILDDHKVSWKAIQEDYETETANGRFKVNIMLAVAEAEREKGGERVKIVMENKWRNKEATFGWQNMPFGYQKEPDEKGVPRLVKDPELRDALQDFWDIATKYENVTKAGKYVNQTYGLTRSKKLWHDVIHNEIYTGTFRGVEGFCEPYVSKEDWQRLQRKPNIKKTQGGRVYLFAGLLRCPACGRTLKSTYTTLKLASGERKDYHCYKCHHTQFDLCSYRHSMSEAKVERWLLKNLDDLLRDDIARVEIERTKPKKKPKTNIAKLRELLRRTNVAYMAGNMEDAEYIAETNQLKDQIAKAETEVTMPDDNRDLTALKDLLETDFRSIYETLSREDKQRFWRSIIKTIHVDGLEVKSVDFL